MITLNFYQSSYFIFNEIFIFLIFLFLLLFIIFNNNLRINNLIQLEQQKNYKIFNAKHITVLVVFFINIIIFLTFLSLFLYTNQFFTYFNQFNENNFLYLELFNNQCYLTIFNIFSQIIICFFCFLYLLITKNFIFFKQSNIINLIIFFPFCQLGIYGLIKANDLISLYLMLELTGISLYAILASQKQSNFSSEAALKYFIMSSFSTSLLLFGISFLYGFTGTINLNEIQIIIENISLTNFHFFIILSGILLIYSALLFKFGASPFHVWIAEIYNGSNFLIIFFINTIPKIGYYSVFYYLTFFTFSSLNTFFNKFFLVISLLSIFFGCFGALYQTKLKKFIAYSTINNTGFIFLGLSLNNFNTLNFTTLFFFIYLLLMLNLFTINLTIINYNTNKPVKKITTLMNFISNNPLLTSSLTFILLTLSGLPPLLGFYIKFFILKNIFLTHYLTISILIAIMSFVSTFYYLRIIKILLFERKTNYILTKNIKFLNSFIIIINTIISISSIFFFTHFITIFEYLW